jgi:ectoine hydroxylase-related dioxygenase (phytanoyl-CoA dioxygenase family)
MERGQFGSFSLLIGFPLSDQQQDFSGNLCLHAGSHHVLNAAYVKPYAEKCVLVNGGKEPSEQQEVRVPKPKLDEPVQVKASRGDVVFVLHRVGHRGGPNYSSQVRKMVYIRVSHRQHGANKTRSLDDLWLDYEGMREVL